MSRISKLPLPPSATPSATCKSRTSPNSFSASPKNGTTTVLDHHASPHAVRGSLFELARAARETGIRNCLCYEVSDRDGPEIMRRGIEENMEFIRAAREEKDDLLAGTFGLHASITLSNGTLAACREAMGDADAGFHVHVAEEHINPQATRLASPRWQGHGIQRAMHLTCLAQFIGV